MPDWEQQPPEEDDIEPGDREVEIVSLAPFGDAVDRACGRREDHPEQSQPKLFLLRYISLALRIAVVLSAVLLLALVVPDAVPSLRNTIQGVLGGALPAPPTPTPTLDAAGNLFYIGVTLPWTTVSLDERPTTIPRVGIDSPIWLTRGHHRIDWQAPPFPDHSCIVSVPLAGGDTCPVSTTAAPLIVGSSAHLVILHEQLSELPLQQQTDLLAGVDAAIQAMHFSATIQPGEHFMDNALTTKTRQPLQATMQFQSIEQAYRDVDLGCQLNVQSATASSNCMFNDENCLQLCTVFPWQLRPPYQFSAFQPGWLAFAAVHLVWSFATPTGHVIARNQPVNSFTGDSLHLVLLHILWSGSGWQISPVLGPGVSQAIIANNIQADDDPACANALGFFSPNSANLSQYRFISMPNVAAGCLVVTTSIDSRSGAQDAWYLERFGTLLAANAAAHKQDPELPTINAYETRLVNQFITFPGQLVKVGTS